MELSEFRLRSQRSAFALHERLRAALELHDHADVDENGDDERRRDPGGDGSRRGKRSAGSVSDGARTKRLSASPHENDESEHYGRRTSAVQARTPVPVTAGGTRRSPVDPLAEVLTPAFRKHVEVGCASHAFDVVAVAQPETRDFAHSEAARSRSSSTIGSPACTSPSRVTAR